MMESITTSPSMKVNKMYKIFSSRFPRNIFSFNFPGFMKRVTGKPIPVIIKVAASKEELNSHEAQILRYVKKWYMQDFYLRRNGVPWCEDIFHHAGFFFFCIVNENPFVFPEPHNIDLAKTRELVNMYHQIVRIELILILFEIIVLIFIFFFR